MMSLVRLILLYHDNHCQKILIILGLLRGGVMCTRQLFDLSS